MENARRLNIGVKASDDLLANAIINGNRSDKPLELSKGVLFVHSYHLTDPIVELLMDLLHQVTLVHFDLNLVRGKVQLVLVGTEDVCSRGSVQELGIVANGTFVEEEVLAN